MNKCAISFSGCGETRWHLDALLRKSRRHLAQRRIFAANGRHVGDGDFLEPQDQWLGHGFPPAWAWRQARSEEHTSELQSLMRISYAVFCLKKKNTTPSVALYHCPHSMRETTLTCKGPHLYNEDSQQFYLHHIRNIN